jgi:glycosyltransferase involved in cell wall biosynthesis
MELIRSGQGAGGRGQDAPGTGPGVAADPRLPTADLRVALVHDWLNGMRGGEKVLAALCERYPDADVFTLFYEPGTVSDTIGRHRIITSTLQRLPFARAHYRRYLPLYPTAIEQFNLDAYDLVISSSHCAAKAIIAPGRARHLCYCHSPMRYAWDQFDAYFGPERVGAVASRWLYRPMLQHLARWDAATASRVGRFVANSQHVAGRIRRYYNREATIVYPPVDTIFYNSDGTPPGRHFLIVSALVPYKRIDVAIEACRRVGATLRIAGDGPDRDRLERLADGHVEFVGRLSDDQIRDEYRRALAILLPGEEDFGIVPVEAQACGRPVVALARGGALETTTPGETGILFDDLTPASMAAALEAVAAAQFDPERLRANAQRFSRERHVERMHTVIHETLDAPIGTRW